MAVAVQSSEQEVEGFCAAVRDNISKGLVESAVRQSLEGLRHFRAAGDKKGEAYALFMQTLARSQLGTDDVGDCLDTANEALLALQAQQDVKSELELMRTMCGVYIKDKAFGEARKTGKELVSRCKERQNDAETAKAYLAYAEVCLAADEKEDAFKAAKDAAALCTEASDSKGKAACHLFLSEAHLQAGDTDDAMDQAIKAHTLAVNAQDIAGQAKAMHKQSLAHASSGASTDALRAAEKSELLFRECGDWKGEVDALLAMSESKVSVCEDNDRTCGNLNILKFAKAAVKLAKERRAGDWVCLGNAHYTYAKVLLQTNSARGAGLAAKDAVRAFRKAGMEQRKGYALLAWAQADLKGGYFGDARGHLEKADAIFSNFDDNDGRGKVYQVNDDIDRAMGIPTQAELEAQRQQEMMMMQQQAMQWQMMQQGGGQMPQNVQMIQQQQYMQDEEQKRGGGGASAFSREASVIDLSGGLDATVVQGKIRALAAQIIGDDEDMETDTPLMEAGLTSNTAVLLRDELSRDVPGINLPPTLIFDYPSIGAIAEFILEASAKKALKGKK
eukprot:CAMPEP_0195096696 /NCGR_PEP_ID=MMETSP0448-20130528/51697_1 /TAXON_ID=66468 /ORGANISM="Heterocapsa triquestra, Strain CCMP 448" /LENGTH=559 /DNA_ID=CAMNT_0040131109 /DNA_START=78 /DNA_END=1757 /DNA_ORIENTATION=-